MTEKSTQFPKGVSGNPKGRPPNKILENSPNKAPSDSKIKNSIKLYGLEGLTNLVSYMRTCQRKYTDAEFEVNQLSEDLLRFTRGLKVLEDTFTKNNSDLSKAQLKSAIKDDIQISEITQEISDIESALLYQKKLAATYEEKFYKVSLQLATFSESVAKHNDNFKLKKENPTTSKPNKNNNNKPSPVVSMKAIPRTPISEKEK